MDRYLALIRRADFIDLYKFGFFWLNPNKTVKLDSSTEDLAQRMDVREKLFSEINPFESSFAYLLIQYTRETDSGGSCISIQDVEHIYPLDNEAKREFEFSFDEHIRIDDPIWSDVIRDVKTEQMFQSSMQGVRNVFKMFELNNIDECRNIIKDDDIKAMLGDVYDEVRPKGKLPLWVYLMRYERHEYYPKNTLGHFMDIVHIVLNFLSEEEVSGTAVESTNIYQILNSYSHSDEQLKTKSIFERLMKDDGAKGFIERISNSLEGVRAEEFIYTAVSYLVIRERYRDKFIYDDNEKAYVKRCKELFSSDFILAAYMLGVTLGYDRTYAALYQTLPLHIYKSQAEIEEGRRIKESAQQKARNEMAQMERESKKSNRSTNSITKETVEYLFPEEENVAPQTYPITYQRYTKADKPWTKSEPKELTIMNEEEYREFKNRTKGQNWRIKQS